MPNSENAIERSYDKHSNGFTKVQRPKTLTMIRWFFSASYLAVFENGSKGSAMKTSIHSKHWDANTKQRSQSGERLGSSSPTWAQRSSAPSHSVTKLFHFLKSYENSSGNLCMKILNWFMTLLLILGTAIVTLWSSQRTPPVDILEESVETPIVTMGEALRVHYIIDRKDVCHVHLEQFLFDSRRGRFSLPDDDYSVAPGNVGRDEFSIVVPIPKGFLPGPATYRAIRSYRCNPIQAWLDWPIIVTAPDVNFDVLPAE